MNTFTLNNVTYTTKQFDFNTLCDLEDYGIDIENINKKPMSLLRAYISLCAGITIEKVGDEIKEHVINGGNLNDIMQPIQKEINNSDFFSQRKKASTVATESTETAE